MSGCKNCKEDCGPCKGEEPKIEYSHKPGNPDIKDLLFPRKEKTETIDLSGNCSHYTYGIIKADQCEYCIHQWVLTNDDEVVEEMIQSMKEKKRSIAANRLEKELKEKKWKRRF
jgi:hypothetical protein